MIDKQQTALYLKKAKESAVETADMIVKMLKNGDDKEEIMQAIKDRYYKGYIKEIYPVDAMNLNLGITINLIEKELVEA